MRKIFSKYYFLAWFLHSVLFVACDFGFSDYMFYLTLVIIGVCVFSVEDEIEKYELKEMQKGDVITLIRRSSKLVMYDDMSVFLTEAGKKLSEETKANKDRVREAIKKAENRGRL